jgi:hypothetical protein
VIIVWSVGVIGAGGLPFLRKRKSGQLAAPENGELDTSPKRQP